VNLQVAVHGGNIHVVPDENRGAIITFNNFDYEVVTTYLQAIDKYGYLKWNEPKVIADSPGPKNYPKDIFLNNDGSVLIGYISGYDSLAGHMIYPKYNPYVHKIDSNGNKLWGEYGTSVKGDTTGRNLDVEYCYDEDGRIFTFWIIGYDLNYPPYYLDSLFIQHISKDGERLWGENGLFIADSIFTGSFMWIVDDDSGGIYVQYRKKNTEYCIRKYDPDGNLNWTLSIPDNFSRAIKDSYGGIVISGVVDSYPSNKIIINRISSEGEKLWGENGIIVDDSVDNNLGYPAEILLNSDSTVSVFWDTQWYPNDDLFLQRYTLEGEQLWQEHLKVSVYATNKTRLGMIKSDKNSNLIIWSENRDTAGNYAQKIDQWGNKLWNEDKFIGSQALEFNIITDGNDGAIIFWHKDPPWGPIMAQQISKNGNLGEVITFVDEDDNINPGSFYLAQNYPNPFNPTTTIRFSLPESGNIKLEIFNLLGEKVHSLVNEFYNAGVYEIEFNAGKLPSGIYFYQLWAGNLRSTKKLTLLK